MDTDSVGFAAAGFQKFTYSAAFGAFIFKNRHKSCSCYSLIKKSGRQDSNLRPLRPERSALAKLSHSPINQVHKYSTPTPELQATVLKCLKFEVSKVPKVVE